jgi:uncharacterized membrane protein YeaQ/YmgE (transglycosylase-associated protein family)
MSLWLIFGAVFLAGSIGGVINAMITDNGFIRPHPERINGTLIMRPGYIGNILIGAVAAVVSWGFYGPFASANLLEPQAVSLTPSTLTGAILVGIAGAKWLTNEVDKNLLKAAASEAAKGQPSVEAAQDILIASPAQALNIAKNMR